jgi:hypothetical protein
MRVNGVCQRFWRARQQGRYQLTDPWQALLPELGKQSQPEMQAGVTLMQVPHSTHTGTFLTLHTHLSA